MSSPEPDVACFDSLPNDLVGVIINKLDFKSSLRLTQACPTARRLVKGERAVPGVFGTAQVEFPRNFQSGHLQVAVSESGFHFVEVRTIQDIDAKAKTARLRKDVAERQTAACIAHLLEWIQVRARAFTEIDISFTADIDRSVLDNLANTFLPNVPSSYRGKISFQFGHLYTTEMELAHLPSFLSQWRALAPAYECGLTLRCENSFTNALLAVFKAAPPLSSLYMDGELSVGIALPALQSLDTSRLKTIDAPCWTFDKLPSVDVLPPTLRDLSLFLTARCWGSLRAFLAPLHRLTALKLDVSNKKRVESLTLAPFAALTNLRLLRVYFWSRVRTALPPVGSDYWQQPVVLPALEELSLRHFCPRTQDTQGEEGGLVQPFYWPTLLSNLEAPKLERLEYEYSVEPETTTSGRKGPDRTLDLPLGRFPRLRVFRVTTKGANLDLPALRAEIAALPHLLWRGDVSQTSTVGLRFYAKAPVSEEEEKAWEDLGFYVMDLEPDVTIERLRRRQKVDSSRS